MTTAKRNYAPVHEACDAIPTDATRDDRMGVVVRALWDAIGDPSGARCSWLGFYVGPGVATPEGDVAGAQEMLLAVREPKPACSPIGLHGACGRSYLQRETLIVRDVAALGAGYVACDPLDVAELVLPCIGEDGKAWGVLDLDAFEAGAFDESDARALQGVLLRAGLTHASPDRVTTI